MSYDDDNDACRSRLIVRGSDSGLKIFREENELEYGDICFEQLMPKGAPSCPPWQGHWLASGQLVYTFNSPGSKNPVLPWFLTIAAHYRRRPIALRLYYIYDSGQEFGIYLAHLGRVFCRTSNEGINPAYAELFARDHLRRSIGRSVEPLVEALVRGDEHRYEEPNMTYHSIL